MDHSESTRRRQARQAAEMRELRMSWAAIAEMFRADYGLSARAAMRKAHGWSQQGASDAWNRLFPDDPKDAKTFSHWERWPHSGHAPSIDTIVKLAQLYECNPKDLLTDIPGYAHLDVANSTDEQEPRPTARLASGPAGPSIAEEVTHDELAEALIVWADRRKGLSRRDALTKLGTALAVAAAGSLVADPGERARLAAVADGTSRVDAAALARVEDIVLACRRQCAALGPQAVARTVLAQRDLMAALLPDVPARHRPRALSAYAQLSQLAGWVFFNLGDPATAQAYYEEARVVAHEAEDSELVTYVLCTMSHLATWRGMPRVGVDHAVAAATWASRSGSPEAAAYAEDVAARAYAVAREPREGARALERERAALNRAGESASASWWYFLDESFYWSTACECALGVGDTAGAHEAAGRSLAALDPTQVQDHAFTLLFQGEAHLQDGDISQASDVIGTVARITSGHGSQRIDQYIDRLRTALAPWQDSRPVTELDERLAAYRPSGRDNTNRS